MQRNGSLLCSRGHCSPCIPVVPGKWLQKAWADGSWGGPSFSTVPGQPESRRKAGLSLLGRCLMAFHLWRGSYGQVPSRHCWQQFPAPQPAQPGSKSFSQLLLFFIFLTKRPHSGQRVFMVPASPHRKGENLKRRWKMQFPSWSCHLIFQKKKYM